MTSVQKIASVPVLMQVSVSVFPTELTADMQRLQRFLMNDDLDARRLFRQLQPVLIGHWPPSVLNSLGSAIERFDYAQALLLLRQQYAPTS